MSEETSYHPHHHHHHQQQAAATTTTATTAPMPPPPPPAASSAATTATDEQQQQRPSSPPRPVLKSDLSRRAVPLGSGASARGTGMLARSHTPTKLGVPSAPAGGAAAAAASLQRQLEPLPSATSAPNPHAHHHHTNPLKRLTANTLRHLHLHPTPSSGSAVPADAASAPSAGAAAAAGVSVRQRALGDVLIGDDPNSSVAVPSAAARLYVDMNADEIGEEARAATRGARLIHPLDPRYRAWWMVTIGAALATGWIEPFRIAFLETRSQGIGSAPSLWLNALSISVLALFCLDILVSFFVGFYDGDGILVMRHRAVAGNYIS
jgi:hypothetical protein